MVSKSVAFYQDLLKGGCPYCGEALVIKKGKYGEFIACQDYCGYTTSIPGRSEYPPPKTMSKCPHSKCDGAGLLPFEKNGKVIANAFIHCSCHSVYGDNPQPESYRDLQVGDFDFPMSSDFRAASFACCGEPDPRYVPETQDLADIEARLAGLEDMVTQPGVVPRKYEHQLDKIKAEVLLLRNKIVESKPKRNVADAEEHNREDITDRLYR